MRKIGSALQTRLFSEPGRIQPEFERGQRHVRGRVSIHFDRAENLYADWPVPTCIISDGPYGVSGYPGDSHTAESLSEWYEPHVEAWSERSPPETTLWFWNTELGWANVHPLLAAHGWVYRCCNVWDKGLGHIAYVPVRSCPVISGVNITPRNRFPNSTQPRWIRLQRSVFPR